MARYNIQLPGCRQTAIAANRAIGGVSDVIAVGDINRVRPVKSDESIEPTDSCTLSQQRSCKRQRLRRRLPPADRVSGLDDLDEIKRADIELTCHRVTRAGRCLVALEDSRDALSAADAHRLKPVA